jgi:RES domain-containing protein
MWAQSGESVVLAVPSAIIPIEFNYLINPQHPDIHQISIGNPQAFLFDKRLLR